MEYHRLIATARDAIGEGESDDYVIRPVKHADQLANRAPAPARVLRRSELSTIARAYERKDAEAGDAQDAFKKTAGRANWAVGLSAFAAGLDAAPADLKTGGDLGGAPPVPVTPGDPA